MRFEIQFARGVLHSYFLWFRTKLTWLDSISL